MLLLTNPNGVYLTKLGCPSSGHNIPSIADIQLIHEFLDYKYFAKGELDQLNWKEMYPRIAKWHDEMLFSEEAHAVKYLRGTRHILTEWGNELPNITTKLYQDDVIY